MFVDTTMDKLFDMLATNPRAVIDSGVVIPCALRGMLEIEDDENIKTTPLPAADQKLAA
jgi:hypothetical protein